MSFEKRLKRISELYAIGAAKALNLAVSESPNEQRYAAIFLYTGTWTSPEESAERTCTIITPYASKRKWILQNIDNDWAVKIWCHYQFGSTPEYPAFVPEVKIESPELMHALTDWYEFLYESGEDPDQLLLRDALIHAAKTINSQRQKLLGLTDDFIAFASDYSTDVTDGWFNELPMAAFPEQIQLIKERSYFPDDQILKYREWHSKETGR